MSHSISSGTEGSCRLNKSLHLLHEPGNQTKRKNKQLKQKWSSKETTPTEFSGMDKECGKGSISNVFPNSSQIS